MASGNTQEDLEALWADAEALWADAEAIWVEKQEEPSFQGYVSADYADIFHKLVKMRSRATTFLEWGSGLGVVTIMASRLGFDAYGIEIEPQLVELSRGLAEKYACKPTFGCGSFIPAEFEAKIGKGDEFHRTITDELAAYDELDMELRDFDLVYAFPWPEELSTFKSIIRQCAAPNTLFLRYDAREGLALSRPAAKRRTH